MLFPYWFTQTFAVLPLALWVYLGMGIPWALLLLPRREWHQRITVIVLSFIFGSACLTAWMGILGTSGGITESVYLRFDWIFAGTLVFTLIGAILAWRKSRQPYNHQPTQPTIKPAFDEWLLIALLSGAFIIVWFATAYWTFTAYDSLWVYGFQGRLYFLKGFIPETIGYYPQYLPLQFTFMQLAVGAIDDHAARVIVPFLHLGSMLSAYVLGKRLDNQRTGIILASIWGLYPHVSAWAHIGDLEIPLTFLMTTTLTFFLQAWQESEPALRRRYALIAGLVFGVAMWTKPTAGAFILGVALLVGTHFLIQWRKRDLWYPRFEVAMITGLACIPLGAGWYLRNLALDLPPLVFPPASWLSLATRSGDLLSWGLLAVLLVVTWQASRQSLGKRGWLALIGSVGMVIGASLSSPLFFPERTNPPMSYITLPEGLLIVMGVLLVGFGLWQVGSWRKQSSVTLVFWGYLLVLPYFLTWFWSYSYHARLSFAIVPLLILPTAMILGRWWQSASWQRWQKGLLGVMIVAFGIPYMVLPLFQIDRVYHDWLWVDRYPTDLDRYRVHNPDMVLLSEQLWGWQSHHGREPVIVAPGEQRLPFFFPLATIINDTLPRDYADLGDATHFIYGTQARWRYEDAMIPPLENRIIASLNRHEVMTQRLRFTDGTFRYELYELHLDQQITNPAMSPLGVSLNDTVLFGDFARLDGTTFSNDQMIGNRIYTDILWEVIAETDHNYWLELSLRNEDTGQVYTRWSAPTAPHDHAYYVTSLWQAGEFIVDQRSVMFDLAEVPDIPLGTNYRLVFNLIDQANGEALPVRVNGSLVEGGYPSVIAFKVGG